MNKQKGFTIIELIVVIAIIAVLAGIVLVNVTSYINKSKDAAIKGNMAGMITNAAVYYDANPAGTGAGFLATAPALNAIAAINTAKGAAPTSTNSGTNWCISSVEVANTALTYCVDNTGAKKEGASETCASGLCP